MAVWKLAQLLLVVLLHAIGSLAVTFVHLCSVALRKSSRYRIRQRTHRISIVRRPIRESIDLSLQAETTYLESTAFCQACASVEVRGLYQDRVSERQSHEDYYLRLYRSILHGSHFSRYQWIVKMGSTEGCNMNSLVGQAQIVRDW